METAIPFTDTEDRLLHMIDGEVGRIDFNWEMFGATPGLQTLAASLRTLLQEFRTALLDDATDEQRAHFGDVAHDGHKHTAPEYRVAHGEPTISVESHLHLRKALAGLLIYSNGKLGRNPYGIPEFADGLKALYFDTTGSHGDTSEERYAWMDVDLKGIAGIE